MKIRKRKPSTYQVYKKLYNRAKKELAKRGETMFDNKILTKREFTARYQSEKLKQQLTAQGKADFKKSKNITRDIVNAQKYKLSYKTAKVYAKGLKAYYDDQYGIENKKRITIRSVLAGKVDFAVLKEEYHNLIDIYGMTSEEAKREIAGLYFGS